MKLEVGNMIWKTAISALLCVHGVLILPLPYYTHTPTTDKSICGSIDWKRFPLIVAELSWRHRLQAKMDIKG